MRSAKVFPIQQMCSLVENSTGCPQTVESKNRWMNPRTRDTVFDKERTRRLFMNKKGSFILIRKKIRLGVYYRFIFLFEKNK
jgi:hypothetical protein